MPKRKQNALLDNMVDVIYAKFHETRDVLMVYKLAQFPNVLVRNAITRLVEFDIGADHAAAGGLVHAVADGVVYAAADGDVHAAAGGVVHAAAGGVFYGPATGTCAGPAAKTYVEPYDKPIVSNRSTTETPDAVDSASDSLKYMTEFDPHYQEDNNGVCFTTAARMHTLPLLDVFAYYDTMHSLEDDAGEAAVERDPFRGASGPLRGPVGGGDSVQHAARLCTTAQPVQNRSTDCLADDNMKIYDIIVHNLDCLVASKINAVQTVRAMNAVHIMVIDLLEVTARWHRLYRQTFTQLLAIQASFAELRDHDAKYDTDVSMPLLEQMVSGYTGSAVQGFRNQAHLELCTPSLPLAPHQGSPSRGPSKGPSAPPPHGGLLWAGPFRGALTGPVGFVAHKGSPCAGKGHRAPASDTSNFECVLMWNLCANVWQQIYQTHQARHRHVHAKLSIIQEQLVNTLTIVKTISSQFGKMQAAFDKYCTRHDNVSRLVEDVQIFAGVQVKLDRYIPHVFPECPHACGTCNISAQDIEWSYRVYCKQKTESGDLLIPSIESFLEILEQHHRHASTVGRFGTMDLFEHNTLQHKMRILLSHYIRTQPILTYAFVASMRCLRNAITAKFSAHKRISRAGT